MADKDQGAGSGQRSRGASAAGCSSGGLVAGGHEVTSVDLTGDPGLSSWQKVTAARSGVDDCGGVFLAAVEMTPMPMLLTDPRLLDNPIVLANAAFLDLTGYAREDILGRNCRFLQGALTSRDTVRQIRTALAERRPIAVEILNYKRDGTPFWNALFIGPVFGPDGKLLHFFASQFDATPRHDVEDALRQAQKMEAIAQLAAGLAHDFNNTLQVVLGNLKRAETRLPNEPEALKPLERARQAARHAATLTQQLLTFARRTRLEARPVILNTVLSEIGDVLSRTLGDGLELRYDLDPGLPPCAVDPAQVEVALLNLLANARDAMPKGGRATIRTGTVTLDEAAVLSGGDGLKPGRYVLLSVEDEGPGMPPDVLARSTEPFFTTKTGKRGLGLATVHGFVRQSRGRLEIVSPPGRGASVRIFLPLASGDPLALPQPTNDKDVLHDRCPGGTVTILAVDDDAGVLELAVHQLTTLGYRVLSARSGEEALEVLGRAGEQVDLLFTDISMPGGMNGLVLAEQARAMCSGIAVLLATGYSDDLMVQQRPTQGAEVLSKPYSQTDLASRVRAALNSRGGRSLDPGSSG
jgi:PAS domain S-box-containing protein